MKKQLRQQVVDRSEQMLRITNKDVYISSSCPTILRIGNDSKTLEGNYLFSILQKKAQEFMVQVCLGLTTTEDVGRYAKADALAFKRMVKKYPKTQKSYWLRIFITLIDKESSELNFKRCKNIIELTKK